MAWLVTGAAVTAFAIFEVVAHDLGPAPIVAFGLLPDLAFLAGLGQAHERGQLPPRAVPPYNLTHRLVFPLALVAVALGALVVVRVLVASPQEFESARHLPLIAYVAGLAWLAHIAFDRALGFGLRTPEGWQRDSRSLRR